MSLIILRQLVQVSSAILFIVYQAQLNRVKNIIQGKKSQKSSPLNGGNFLGQDGEYLLFMLKKKFFNPFKLHELELYSYTAKLISRSMVKKPVICAIVLYI